MEAPTEADYALILRNWFIQSSAKVKTGGEQISQPGLLMDRWYPANVPATVLGTLVQNNVHADLYFGDNLKNIPGDDFGVSWWYRTEFPLTADPSKTAFKLEFDGINYRANIWLNGKKIADVSEAYGAFRRFEFDVTAAAAPGGMNVLAVEVFPPRPGDPTIGFVDWNPVPPDKNMGIWREVRVKSTGNVSINFPQVITKLDLETLKEARLTVSAELQNNSPNKVSGTLEGRLESAKFSREVTLEPKESKKVIFAPEDTPEMKLKNPRVWWTHDLGTPELYVLGLAFRQKMEKPRMEEKPAIEEKAAKKEEDKATDGPWGKGKDKMMPRSLFSDVKMVRFGIREVSDYFNDQGHRGYKLNGKKILIRGGGWMDDLLLDNRRRKVAAEVAYARHMNLNALRLEGFWGSSEDLYNLCDENGILLMAGWSCQWEWEHYIGKPTDERYGGILTPEEIKLVAQSWKDQVRWLRNHPSIFVWAEASDLIPKPELEKEYIQILKEDDPTRPSLVSTKGKTSELTGKSGVKMLGPYDWVPPVYWYVDTKNGGAYGFNTETGPGPQVPPIESLKKMIPEKDLWPINDIWNFHCSRGEFKTLERYNEAMTKRLGAPRDLNDYLAKAQYLNYEGMRAMFEAFVVNKYKSTGIIQWMYNAAWPKLWWQLYDYYLMPNGAFYGARKACSPLHVIYNYGTREVLAVNNTLKPENGLKASIRVYDNGLKEKYAKDVPVVGLAADEVKALDVLPEVQGLDAARFVDLRLKTKDNVLVSANFYVLSPKAETLDEANSIWYVTPVKEFADLTALQGLPFVQVKEKHSFKKDGLGQIITVEIENPTPNLAFQVELNVYKNGTDEVVLPIFWDDNYVTLLPGERRKVQGFFGLEDLGGMEPELRLRGWNLK
jgi:exo-1,4-beta-D-glucosaminidase